MPTVTATELTTLRAAACPDPTLHAVADAPLRPLSDLLRTATEFDEIAGHLVDEYDLLAIELARIDALRAAVRALQGPPAPFRPQQAHAAPAKCNEPDPFRVAAFCTKERGHGYGHIFVAAPANGGAA